MDYAEIQNLSPQEVQQLMELGIIPSKLEQSQSDLLRSQSMQDSPTPQGRAVGNIYRAANPLEHLATALRRFKGLSDERAARQQADKLRADQTSARRAFLNAYMNRGTRPAMNPMANMLRIRNPHAGGY